MRRRCFATGHWTNPGSPPSEKQARKNAQMGNFSSKLVISEGVEPSIFWMRTRRPRPLDDETLMLIF